jgi:ABC-type transport system involved in resistance to organic solvents, permease component
MVAALIETKPVRAVGGFFAMSLDTLVQMFRPPFAWREYVQYVPLNDGNNWKGDPNATLSGQDIPQLPPGAVRAHPVARPPQPLVPAELLAGAEEGVQPGGPDTGSGRRSLQSLLLPSEPGQ